MTTYITTVGTSASQASVKHIAPPGPSSDDKSSRPRRLDAALVHEQGGIKKTVELLKPHFCAFDF